MKSRFFNRPVADVYEPYNPAWPTASSRVKASLLDRLPGIKPSALDFDGVCSGKAKAKAKASPASRWDARMSLAHTYHFDTGGCANGKPALMMQALTLGPTSLGKRKSAEPERDPPKEHAAAAAPRGAWQRAPSPTPMDEDADNERDPNLEASLALAQRLQDEEDEAERKRQEEARQRQRQQQQQQHQRPLHEPYVPQPPSKRKLEDRWNAAVPPEVWCDEDGQALENALTAAFLDGVETYSNAGSANTLTNNHSGDVANLDDLYDHTDFIPEGLLLNSNEQPETERVLEVRSEGTLNAEMVCEEVLQPVRRAGEAEASCSEEAWPPLQPVRPPALIDHVQWVD